jgi:hypothetical protein
MVKQLKTVLLASPLVLAGYLFGTTCSEIGQAYRAILYPSAGLAALLVRFLLSAFALCAAASVVAALLRPVLSGAVALVLSGTAMLVAWEVTAPAAILVLAYVLAGVIYLVRTRWEMDQRIQFSVNAITSSHGFLLGTLALVACASLYAGTATSISRQGFTVPDAFVDLFTQQMEMQIGSFFPVPLPEAMMTGVTNDIAQSLRMVFEDSLEPFEPFIPLVLSLSALVTLWAVTRLLSWVPGLALRVLFPLLAALRVTHTVTETQRVERLEI